MRSSSSVRTAARYEATNVPARTAAAPKAANSLPATAKPTRRQIVHVIDDDNETPDVSRRGSLLAVSGALISTLAIATLSAGPAEALG